MAKYRGYGDGTIYQRESDQRWVAVVTLNNRRLFLYGKTRAEAQKKLRAVQIEYEKGQLATGPKQIVKQFLEHWLCIKKETETIKPSTLISYSSYLRNRVIPIIGQVRLQNLTADQIQLLYSQLLKDGLSVNTTRLIHTILSTALKDAIRWKRLSTNPCKDVTPPRADQQNMQFLTLEEAQALIQAAEAHPLGCMITLAVTTGMRRGELLALRWADVNLNAMTLRVKRSVSYIKVGEAHEFYESDPKTTSSMRTITLPPFVVNALKHHRAQQMEARLLAGKKWKDQGLVFPNKTGGFYDVSTLKRHFFALLTQAGLPQIRFHDLRHSAATILLGMGINIKVIQELLGHSNVSTTLRVYSHVLPGMQQAAMNDLDARYRELM